MSLNSLQDDMSRRAASMAAIAKRANSPQEIQAMQQQLVTGVQNGTIKSYVGIPLIQELTQRLGEAKAQMAQTMAGAGMQQPQNAPIAQQVMQQAAQDSQGLEALPSNLPQEYAGGGIIAFEDGGEVERYQNKGFVPNMSGLPAYSATNPNAAFGDFLKQLGVSTSEYANARPEAQKNILDMFRSASEAPKPMGASVTAPATPTAPATSGSYRAGQAVGQAVRGGAAGTGNFLSRGLMGMIGGPATGAIGLALTPSSIADDQAVLAALRGEGYRGQPYDVLNARKILESAGMDPNKAPVAPATSAVAPYDPSTATLRSQYTKEPYPTAGAAAPVAAAPAAPAIPGASSVKPPTLQTYMPTAATLPVRAAPVLTSLNEITKDLPTKQKTIFSNAVTEEQAKLEAMDKPGSEAREEKFGKREAAQEKDSAMRRALDLMGLGFGIAGSKERTLAGALGNEGRQGIQTLIQGEAASRAAKDRLDDARDNFEQQKVQAKKGNYQAAQTAGREASRDLLAATQFALTGAQAGNAQAISLYSTLSQRDIGGASLSNQAEQLKLSGVDQQNRNVLGLAGLDVQNRQLAQQGAIAKATLAANEKRFAAMNDANKARIMQARSKGLNDFMMGEGAQLRAQLAKEYGPNFLTATDARSLEAQRLFNQRKQAYLMDITGQAIDSLSARQADALLD